MQRTLVYMPLSELQRAPRNAKDHAGELITESVQRFGVIEPQVLDGRTDKLVAGHGRLDEYERARDAGEPPPDGIDVADGDWQVPVVLGWSSVDDEDAEAAGIALNRIGEVGGWRRDVLAESLAALDASKGLTATGYNRGNLDDLVAVLTGPSSLDDLAAQLGQPGEEDFWPVLHFKIPPELRARFMVLVEGITGEWDQFAHLIDLAEK